MWSLSQRGLLFRPGVGVYVYREDKSMKFQAALSSERRVWRRQERQTESLLFLEGAGCGWPWFITGKEHGCSSVQRVLEGLMPSHMEGTFPDCVSD